MAMPGFTAARAVGRPVGRYAARTHHRRAELAPAAKTFRTPCYPRGIKQINCVCGACRAPTKEECQACGAQWLNSSYSLTCHAC